VKRDLVEIVRAHVRHDFVRHWVKIEISVTSHVNLARALRRGQSLLYCKRTVTVVLYAQKCRYAKRTEYHSRSSPPRALQIRCPTTKQKLSITKRTWPFSALDLATPHIHHHPLPPARIAKKSISSEYFGLRNANKLVAIRPRGHPSPSRHTLRNLWLLFCTRPRPILKTSQGHRAKVTLCTEKLHAPRPDDSACDVRVCVHRALVRVRGLQREVDENTAHRKRGVHGVAVWMVKRTYLSPCRVIILT